MEIDEKIYKVLENVFPGVDFRKSNDFVENECIDSIGLVVFISELESMFDITIPFDYIEPDNFKNIESIKKMIKELND